MERVLENYSIGKVTNFKVVGLVVLEKYNKKRHSLDYIMTNKT